MKKQVSEKEANQEQGVEYRDKTTQELINKIVELSKEVKDAQNSRRWYDHIHTINENFQKRSAQWNSFTLMGSVTTVNKEGPHQNFWITLDGTYYCMEYPNDFDVGDIVMVTGRITGHDAHDAESREFYHGVDRIYVKVDRAILISKGTDLVFNPEN